jgi:hypothetical protein
MSSHSAAIVSSVETPAKIVVRVIHNNSPDDILVFEPDMETTGFNITFTQATISVTTTHWMEYDGVVPYLTAFVNCLRLDTDADACANIQVDAPGLPSVLLVKTNALQYLACVLKPHLDALEDDDEWPMEKMVATRA